MRNYTFTNKIAERIHKNEDELKKEAINMYNSFKKQGNEKHSLEMNHIYNKAIFLENVFYDELVPAYQAIKND